MITYLNFGSLRSNIVGGIGEENYISSSQLKFHLCLCNKRQINKRKPAYLFTISLCDPEAFPEGNEDLKETVRLACFYSRFDEVGEVTGKYDRKKDMS